MLVPRASHHQPVSGDNLGLTVTERGEQVVTAMDEPTLGEWICDRCGEVYDTEETALDCGWWDWVYDISTSAGFGTGRTSQAA